MIGPVLGVSLIVYFAFHLVHGDRGLVAWRDLTQRIEETEAMAREVAAQRAILERRVALLRPDSLDRDMLDERARSLLNLAHPDDVVVPRSGPDGR
ncbi:MAG: septum formation initiator family protein [Alphaproteobacteria bacterium]